ncbi:response regulator receiver domain-containing protein [Hydrogenispora ethanolica]|uniref:Response regulator receiver domain-containing protein n=1 Tax=Hydrogenispora ethanolica TaxID=1082276 RepID=A0A4R1RYB1_HYDET|nr:response regulator [Hydrogenispora ethanolica]TCL71559.1 response regulator receiver domain-containing protein [Hydrogenispora ethanolica]
MKAKVLIMEDNENIALVERICLEAAGYEVLVAADGIQGLETALHDLPQLILADILLPKMNGYLVLEALQNNPATRDIPVIVTSAKAQVDDLKKAHQYPIRQYLIKPFAPEELLAGVAEVLKEMG